jgi:hypothetical protein
MFRFAARLLAAVGVSALALAWTAEANLRNRRELVSRYPALKGSRLDNCNTCHAIAPPQLNPYGAAWKEARYDFAAIEKVDSDGDKATNRAEIDSLTFPGDPKDRPGQRKVHADSAFSDTTRKPTPPDSAKKK